MMNLRTLCWYLALLTIVLLCAWPAMAQTPTVVSGTITGSDGSPYSFAKVSAQLIPTTATPTVIANGIPTQIGGQQNSTADANGAFSMNLFCNSAGGGCSPISPGGTQWQFTVQANGAPPPLGTGPQSCVALITVTGASQSVTTNFSCPALSRGGVSGSATNPAPKMAFYLTSDCSATVNAYCQNTPADSLEFNDCNWTAGAVDVNCTASHFTSADVGKNAMGAANCGDDNQGTGGGNLGGQISTTTAVTIASFISGTHITLSAIPANAVASNGCFIYGHLDDAGAAALDTAMQASNTCPKLFLAAANYFFSSPHFFTNPPACALIGPGQATFGTTSLPAGFELEGRGVGPTTLWMNTNFPNGDACTHKAGAQVNGGCWAIPIMGKWSDVRLDGGGQHTAPNMNNKVLLTMAVGTLANFTCTNMGWKGTSQVGINMGLLSQLYQVNNSGCGTIGLQAEGGGSTGLDNGFRVVIENSSVNALLLQGNSSNDTFTCYWCDFSLPASGSANTQVINNAGGLLRLYGTQVYTGNAGSSNTGITTYKCTSATGSLYADGVTFAGGAGGSTDNGALWNNVSGCKINITNSVLTAQSTGGIYFDVAGATLNDQGGNTWTGGLFTGTGNIIADGHSLTGFCSGVANASSTLGLYGTGPNATPTTCTSATIGSGVIMTQPRTLRPMVCTSTATTVSVACTVLVNGVASALTCTMTAATFCNDNSHSVSVNKNDLVSLRIVTGAAETGANIQVFTMWQ